MKINGLNFGFSIIFLFFFIIDYLENTFIMSGIMGLAFLWAMHDTFKDNDVKEQQSEVKN